MDSTQSTIQCNFLLTTILVIDNHREELPVTWAISNREDTEILTVFMRSLKGANGGKDYVTNIFMSDLANTFLSVMVSSVWTS